MQIDRLMGIVFILLDKKKATASELAQHFEVAKRTILRDIDVLARAGVPVYTTKGKGGGIFISDRFTLDRAALTEAEQRQLLFALRSAPAIEQSDALLSKLGSLFQTAETDWIEVDFSRWGAKPSDTTEFDRIKTGILDRQVLSFRYASSYGTTTDRTVCPLKLVYKRDAWYLQAYCLDKKDYRTFKVNRMFRLRLRADRFTEQSFSPPPIDTSTPSPVQTPLELRFAAEVAYRVYDEFDTAAITQNDDGSFTVRTELPEDAWLYGFLLSFGSAVTVHAPEQVRARLVAQATKILDLYPNKT